MLHQADKKFTKEKITVTLNPRLIKEVDRWSKVTKIKSRSAAIEKLIEEWMAEREKRRLEEETEAYYLSLSKHEKAEDKNWSALSSDQAIRRFEK